MYSRGKDFYIRTLKDALANCGMQSPVPYGLDRENYPMWTRIAGFWRVSVGIAALFVLTVAGVACATGEDGSKSLVIYSGRSESLIGPLIEDFEELTGADVRVNYGSTSPLAATLL